MNSNSKQKESNLGSYGWLRRFNKRATNRLTLRFAGKHVYAVVHHRGRRSGITYQTPVIAMPSTSGFIFPLPYGQETDWCRNVRAAGGGQLEWRGRVYNLRDPRLVSPSEALPAFPGWLKLLLRRVQVYLKVSRTAGPLLPPEQKLRKILVYGAGVLGSLYAGKLHQAGFDVTLLARGARLEELIQHGLVLVEDGSGKIERFPIPYTDRLTPEDAYDLVIVIVRKNQIASVLPALAANQKTPNILFMVNSASGPDSLVQTLGRERVMLGFPGAGGQRVEGIVRYRMTSVFQPTTIGELDGRRTERLVQTARAFKDAGLPVTICDQMDAWLKTHVALVSPVANAIYLAGGSNYRLARTQDGLILIVRAVKEGLRVLDALGIPVAPARYRAFTWIPEPLLVAILARGMNLPQAETILARHANAARDEMLALAEEFQALVKQSGIPTPAIDALSAYMDPARPPLPEGQSDIKLGWRSTVAFGTAAAGILVSAGILASWLSGRQRK